MICLTKNRASRFLQIILLLLCCSCMSCSIDVQKSSKSRDLSPQLSDGEQDKLVDGNTKFAFDLYEEALKTDNSSNVFFSPFSISIALAMTYAGARNNTAVQMADALHFTLPQERLHNAFNALDLALKDLGQDTASDYFRLNICNTTWGQKNYTFLEAYLDVLALNYGAGMHLLDFQGAPEASRGTINTWVSLQTDFKINNLLPAGSISSYTRLVLTNAIYFKADWLSPFEKEATKSKPFNLLDGSEIHVPTMTQDARFNYYESEGEFEAIELPYKGDDVSMLIILPSAGNFSTFEPSLDTALIDNIVTNMNKEFIRLYLPSFSFEWSTSLVDILKKLGMTDAFGFDADLSGINGLETLAITDILHKAFIGVDEKGTEAAAATAVIIGETAIEDPDIIVSADHPFILLIRDKNTGTILFMGRVIDPR